MADQEDQFAHYREDIAKLRDEASGHEELAAELRGRAEQATMMLNILERKCAKEHHERDAGRRARRKEQLEYGI